MRDSRSFITTNMGNERRSSADRPWMDQFLRDVAWDREILSVIVNCKMFEEGCKWKGELRLYKVNLCVPFLEKKGLKKTSKKKRTLEERVTNEKKRLSEIRDRLESSKDTQGERSPRYGGGKRPGTTDPRLRGMSNKTINRQSYRPLKTLIDRLYPSVSSISILLLHSNNFPSLTVTAFKLHHNSIYNVFQYS